MLGYIGSIPKSRKRIKTRIRASGSVGNIKLTDTRIINIKGGEAENLPVTDNSKGGIGFVLKRQVNIGAQKTYKMDDPYADLKKQHVID